MPKSYDVLKMLTQIAASGWSIQVGETAVWLLTPTGNIQTEAHTIHECICAWCEQTNTPLGGKHDSDN